MNITKKILPVLVVLFKGCTVGSCIGLMLGGGLGVILAKLYGDHSTVSNLWLIVIFAVIGIIAGSFYGSTVAYSHYRKTEI